MGSNLDKLFENITHLLVNEVHERDIHTDILLIAIKVELSKKTNLKIVLIVDIECESIFRIFRQLSSD